jgi:hypothetical protein
VLILSIFNSSAVTIALLAATVIAFGAAKTIDEFFGGKLAPDTRLSSFYARAKKIEVVSLGSSQSLGIHFPSLHVEGHSFFGGGMDIETSDLKFRAILPHTPQLKCIIFPLTPGILSYSAKASGHDRRDWVAYAPWPTKNSDLNFEEWLLFVKSRLYLFVKPIAQARSQLSSFFLIPPSYETLGDSTEQASCKNRPNDRNTDDEFGIRNGYIQHTAPASCLNEQAIATTESHLTRLALSPDVLDGIREDNIRSLRSIGRVLSAHGAHLILVAMPLTTEYLSRISFEEFRDLDLLTDALEAETSITIYDFSEFFHSSTSTKNTYFYDVDHLALSGARVFSSALRKVIPECLP